MSASTQQAASRYMASAREECSSRCNRVQGRLQAMMVNRTSAGEAQARELNAQLRARQSAGELT